MVSARNLACECVKTLEITCVFPLPIYCLRSHTSLHRLRIPAFRLCLHSARLFLPPSPFHFSFFPPPPLFAPFPHLLFTFFSFLISRRRSICSLPPCCWFAVGLVICSILHSLFSKKNKIPVITKAFFKFDTNLLHPRPHAGSYPDFFRDENFNRYFTLRIFFSARLNLSKKWRLI